MSDAAPLLAAIAANPDDDLPRLVYADWLDENGDPDRAEFIRLQCHSARVGPLDPSWAPCKLREYDLFIANEAKWRPAGLNPESPIVMNRWRRGFPAVVDLEDVVAGRFTNGEWCNGSLYLTALSDRYDLLWDTWQSVGRVRKFSFSGCRRDCRRVFNCPELRTVESISLEERPAEAGQDTLVS